MSLIFLDGTENSSLSFGKNLRPQSDQEEFGDWQTNINLAVAVCQMLKRQGVRPKVIIEPTCGIGNFIFAALQVFDSVEDVYGIEIYKPYLDQLKLDILQHYIESPDSRRVSFHFYNQSIFDFDMSQLEMPTQGREVLVIGNPPWATNSKLREIGSENLPLKSNFKKVKGLEAITGKGNFDICESICSQMIGFLSTKKASHLAMLIKNSVAKNIMYEQRNCRFAASSISQYNIDAKKEFGVSVAASLLCIWFDGSASRVCQVKDFYTMKSVRVYGWTNDCFVADMVSYKNSEFIDGRSQLTWWSGMKHDCAKVMELKRVGDRYVNGLGECVDIEDDVVYPLLKSSDIKGDSISSVQKYVIVTQKGTSEDTDWMKDSCPKAYKYLSQHANLLDERRSVIYRNRPRFCIFGIGSYSFKPYKVVISGLYKQTRFSLVKAIEDKPVMLDDTCYLLGFDRLDDALAAHAF